MWNLSFQELAVAFGLLTPLLLGVLAFIDKRFPGKKNDAKQKDADDKAEPVVQGMTVGVVDYAAELVVQLKKDRDEADARAEHAEREAAKLKQELEIYKSMKGNGNG